MQSCVERCRICGSCSRGSRRALRAGIRQTAGRRRRRRGAGSRRGVGAGIGYDFGAGIGVGRDHCIRCCVFIVDSSSATRRLRRIDADEHDLCWRLRRRFDAVGCGCDGIGRCAFIVAASSANTPQTAGRRRRRRGAGSRRGVGAGIGYDFGAGIGVGRDHCIRCCVFIVDSSSATRRLRRIDADEHDLCWRLRRRFDAVGCGCDGIGRCAFIVAASSANTATACDLRSSNPFTVIRRHVGRGCAACSVILPSGRSGCSCI